MTHDSRSTMQLVQKKHLTKHPQTKQNNQYSHVSIVIMHKLDKKTFIVCRCSNLIYLKYIKIMVTCAREHTSYTILAQKRYN